ncbi:DUF3347 domain-containing protein [Chryseobacterium sp.]|uniref:DUF3347 domain-containing protein n=1 Tax=Chryseobacterium sp. TaxID=1871047 RepID=UPI0025BEE761|nr:DUF3347 domain-containing protein [Chryseobacterium sp.]
MKNYIITALLTVFSVLSVSAQVKTDAQVSNLYKNYIEIKTSLSSDDADKASASASEFIKSASSAKALPESQLNKLKKDADIIAKTKNIKNQREAFQRLSANMIVLAKEYKLSAQPVFVQHCPMKNADWLSNEKQVVNPYYGKAMLSCGNVKSEIK